MNGLLLSATYFADCPFIGQVAERSSDFRGLSSVCPSRAVPNFTDKTISCQGLHPNARLLL